MLTVFFSTGKGRLLYNQKPIENEAEKNIIPAFGVVVLKIKLYLKFSNQLEII